jgi:hypothetical protein
VPINERMFPRKCAEKSKMNRTKHKAYVLEMLKDASSWKDKKKHDFLLGFFKNEAERFMSALSGF